MQDDTKQPPEIMAKHTAKNSIFLDLFQNKRCLLKLYKRSTQRTQQPQRITFTDVTITNVLTDNLYHDFGFTQNNLHYR